VAFNWHKTSILQKQAVKPFGISSFPRKARRAPQIRWNKETNAKAAAPWLRGVRLQGQDAHAKPYGVMDCVRVSSRKRTSVQPFRPRPKNTMISGHILTVLKMNLGEGEISAFRLALALDLQSGLFPA
jgi:hypothetical protein